MAFTLPLDQLQIKENQSFGLTPCNNINDYVLAANTAKTITFPVDVNGANPNYVFFAANGIFYARWSGAATVPVADSADGVGSELTPAQRYVNGITSVSVIAPAATIISIAYFY